MENGRISKNDARIVSIIVIAMCLTALFLSV